jgi:hypothetical protein
MELHLYKSEFNRLKFLLHKREKNPAEEEAIEAEILALVGPGIFDKLNADTEFVIHMDGKAELPDMGLARIDFGRVMEIVH